MSHLTDQCDQLREIFTDSLWTRLDAGRWLAYDGIHHVSVQYCMGDVTVVVSQSGTEFSWQYRGTEPVKWFLANFAVLVDTQIVESIVTPVAKHEHTERVNPDEEASSSSCHGRRTDPDARTRPLQDARGVIRL